MKSYIFKLLGASRFLVIYEKLYFIIFRWFLKLFSLYLLKPPMNDFKINMYKLVLVQKHGNKSQMSWEHNINTFSVQASCGPFMMFSTEIRSSLADSNNATMTALEETAAASDIFAPHRRFQQILLQLSMLRDRFIADLATCSTISNSP